jgi:hypothetical protein
VQSLNSVLFTLVRRDGTILFRHPDPSGTAGRKLSAEATWLQALSRGEKGFRILAQADGNVRFSNRPIGVKRFQTIHQDDVDVAHGLVLLFGIGAKALPSWGFEDKAEQSSPRSYRLA